MISGRSLRMSRIEGISAWYEPATQEKTRPAVARRAVRAARLDPLTGRVGPAVRDTAPAALSKAAPSLFLCGSDGVAGRRPPGGPSGAGGGGSGAPRMLAADHGRRGPEENTP